MGTIYSTLKKNDRVKKNYRKKLDVSFVFVLVLFILFTLGFQRLDKSQKLILDIPEVITGIDIHSIVTPKFPQKPDGPKIPVESDDLDEDIVDDPFPDVVTEWDTTHLTPIEPNDPTADLPIPIHKVEIPPKLLHAVSPVYPKLAKLSGLQERVWVKIVIDESGNVIQADILKSNPVFNEAARNAVMQFKFKPAFQNNRTVKVSMKVPLDFKLR